MMTIAEKLLKIAQGQTKIYEAGVEVGKETGGSDTSDATATAGEIFAGETAYTADGKVTGTFTIEEELTEQNDLISQIATLVTTKANPQGGTDTSDATATAGDILSGKTAYVDGEKITGTIATKTSSNLTASGATVTVPAGYYASQATKSVATVTQATPSVSIDANGKITASATQTAGYVAAGTKSGTKQMTTKAATTYTPTTSNQTIASGTYLTGTQTIKGDANLKAENIAEGVSIFGITGTHSGGGSGGGSVETVTITFSRIPDPEMEICYIDGSLAYNRSMVTVNGTYTVLKGSILAIINSSGNYFDKCTHIAGNGMCRAFLVTG